MRPAPKWLMAGALFAFALLVRVLAIGLTQFDGLYGQDAFAYYDYARELWQRAHELQAPAPFWWPLGYPALVALAFNLGGLTPLVAQAVSVLSGALVAPLIFWWVGGHPPHPPKYKQHQCGRAGGRVGGGAVR